jgi:hypothetical protein
MSRKNNLSRRKNQADFDKQRARGSHAASQRACTRDAASRRRRRREAFCSALAQRFTRHTRCARCAAC